MSLFGNKVDPTKVNEEQDRVGGGGFTLLPSGVYDLKITAAYITKSTKSDALALNLKGMVGDQEHREQIWFTNGKGDVTFEKDGEVEYMPGFNLCSALALLTCNAGFQDLDPHVEKRTINLYNYDQKKEVPTEVDMIVPMLDKVVKVTMLQQKEIKMKKNPNDNDKYTLPSLSDSGELEFRESNTIQKFMLFPDGTNNAYAGCTVTEIKHAKMNNAEPKADYMAKWVDTWEGKVKEPTQKQIDEAMSKSGATSTGLPSQAANSQAAAQAQAGGAATNKLF